MTKEQIQLEAYKQIRYAINLDLENDMGNVSLVMADTRDQYKVTKDGSMSSVHVSDASQVIGNKNIDIDTDMGNVTIHFKGE